MAKPAETMSVRIPADVHREIQIASVYRREPMQELVRHAWRAFKVSEGKRLHQPIDPDQNAA